MLDVAIWASGYCNDTDAAKGKSMCSTGGFRLCNNGFFRAPVFGFALAAHHRTATGAHGKLAWKLLHASALQTNLFRIFGLFPTDHRTTPTWELKQR
jgi:hypothetical protein